MGGGGAWYSGAPGTPCAWQARAPGRAIVISCLRASTHQRFRTCFGDAARVGFKFVQQRAVPKFGI
eukprot:2623226-Lingulodinium_polyedra.AAC.1